jgi:hypothetical protein
MARNVRLLDDVRAERRPVGARVHGVGGQRRRVHLTDPLVQQREAVLELVVAQCHGIEADGVHLQCYRVDLAVVVIGSTVA